MFSLHGIFSGQDCFTSVRAIPLKIILVKQRQSASPLCPSRLEDGFHMYVLALPANKETVWLSTKDSGEVVSARSSEIWRNMLRAIP